MASGSEPYTSSNKSMDPTKDDDEDEPWVKEFKKEIRKFRKENDMLCFRQGAEPECETFWNKYHHDLTSIRGSVESKYVKPETLLTLHQQYRQDREKMEAKGYRQLGNETTYNEIVKLQFTLRRSFLRPNPTIECKVVYEDEEEEDGYRIYECATFRGGPNITSRGGGLRAYKFGQADKEGNSHMVNLKVVSHLKYRPQTKRQAVIAKKIRFPVTKTDEELRQLRRERIAEIEKEKSKLKWD